MKYKRRIADDLLSLKLESFGASLITGPKGCGKTTTAKQQARSVIELQDEDNRDQYLAVAKDQVSLLLVGDRPRLFDEWQDAPKLWGAVRKAVDDEQKNGLFILTGSTSQIVKTPHTGTQRISTLKMYPMSLYESEESNGEVSLIDLFDNSNSFTSCHSDLTIEKLIFAICRGGWPRAVNNTTDRSKLEIAKDLFRQTHSVDASNVDGVNRNSIWMETILKSYSRNICTQSKRSTIFTDVNSTCEISQTTFFDYIKVLEELYIIEDVEAWCPAIRSKTAIRSAKKNNFVDPSIAVAALGLNPQYFNQDFQTLGFLFESLCIRDLKIYSSKNGGKVSYYRDRYGLESDVVLHLEDGRYALIEVKLGSSGVDEGAQHLCKLEDLIRQNNEVKGQIKIRMPDLKVVLTGTEFGYKREDGVLVLPIGCLKD